MQSKAKHNHVKSKPEAESDDHSDNDDSSNATDDSASYDKDWNVQGSNWSVSTESRMF